jgi:hypothetical protein
MPQLSCGHGAIFLRHFDREPLPSNQQYWNFFHLSKQKKINFGLDRPINPLQRIKSETLFLATNYILALAQMIDERP